MRGDLDIGQGIGDTPAQPRCGGEVGYIPRPCREIGGEQSYARPIHWLFGHEDVDSPPARLPQY